MSTIAILGAGGKMGGRLTDNLVRHNHRLLLVEVSEAGRANIAQRGLTPTPQGQAIAAAEVVILAGNYGEAGALELYGPRYRLPPPVSPAGSYWFFGAGPRPGRVVLAIGIDPAALALGFRSVREVGRVGHRWAVAEERDVPITLAMKPRRTLQEVWPSLGGPRSGAGAGAARR